ncbi:MAG: 4Fe-4S binding protein [Desulfomonilia bacterium]|jgi:heterodisulfide reductase subunit A-like polyferredoxin
MYEITDSCISCTTCVGECPNGAISETESCCEIDQVKCDGCGSCAQMCPVEAIVEKT